MNNTVSWSDWLRIERVVWSLDQQLYDLPFRSRIETRREVRANLLTASQDIGASEALRQLGSSSQLAHDYLNAELGDRPHHSWINAGLFLCGAVLVLTSLLTSAARAFGDGVRAGNPAATGTYHWDGIAYLQTPVTYTAHGGGITGGAIGPLGYLLLVLITIYVGKLWRLPVVRRLSRRAR